MRTKSDVALAGLAVACAATLLACEGEEASGDVELGGSEQLIIGGVAANSPKLNAIGTLGFIETYEDWETGEQVETYFPFCTASLIASKTVLTAKHCVQAVQDYAAEAGYIPAFGIGPDAWNPQRKVEIVAWETAPVNTGGILEIGHDVGVVHLAQAVTDLPLVKYAQLTQADVGKRFGAIGYGIMNAANARGPRLAGNVTVNALEGKWYELMFGNYDAFRKWVHDMGYDWFDGGGDGDVGDGDGDGDGDDDGDGDGGYDPDQYWRELYENTQLLPGYEADVGRKKGDVQPCRGDSGGPLVKSAGGELVSYGVTSAAIHGTTLDCDKGSIYAVFGPEVLTFIDQAKQWVDPCETLTTHGVCDGDTVLRCTRRDEGERRSIETDCSLFGETCALTPSNEAVCVGIGEEPLGTDGQPLGCVPNEEQNDAFNGKLESRIEQMSIGPTGKIESKK
jgi:hypothetical protein